MHRLHVPTDRVPRLDRPPSRRAPSWLLLVTLIVLGMAAWGAGILELPASYHHLADVVGGLVVVAILALWVRRNGVALANPRERSRDGEPRLQIRVIRSRRPPLPELGGPQFPARRRPRPR